MAIIEITEANAGLLLEARQTVDGTPTDMAKLLRAVTGYATGAKQKAFVIQEEGVVCGYIGVDYDGHEFPVGATKTDGMEAYGHIAKVGVSVAAQGKGFATQLLQAAEQWLKSRGAKGVWLDYLANNEPAVRLYQRNGYVDVDEFQDTQNRTRRIAAKPL